MASQAIVNLSLAYDGSASRGWFDDLFNHRRSTLFVVAAGNTGQPVGVAAEYPGALGADWNVISVAAHDNKVPSELTSFTNYCEKVVGIAAPGCNQESWIDADHHRPISGTSQAAPWVTFASALLASLDNRFTPAQIRNRLLISGDLLGGGDVRWNVITGSRLNIVKALLTYDDLVRVRIPDATQPLGYRVETWLGTIKSFNGFRCSNDQRAVTQRPRDDVWAFKRQGSEAFLLTDKGSHTFSHCPADMAASTASGLTASLKIDRVALFDPNGTVADPAIVERTFKIEELEEVIFGGVGDKI